MFEKKEKERKAILVFHSASTLSSCIHTRSDNSVIYMKELLIKESDNDNPVAWARASAELWAPLSTCHKLL